MLLAVALIALPISGSAQNIRDRQVFRHDGIDRHYYLHIPHNLPDNAPLVVALHGLGGSAARLRFGIGLQTLADTKGFAALFPQGLRPKRRDSTHWNSGFDFSSVDDVGFLTALVSDLQVKHALDPDRTFVLGISNGGYMAYTLACRAPGTFAAIASVIGTMGGLDWQSCIPSPPASVLHIHGTADPYIPYSGFGHWAGGWGGAPAVPDVVDFWVGQHDATPLSQPPNLPNTTWFKYQNPETGGSVWLLRLDGFGHDWPHPGNAGFSALEVIWDFFAASPILKR